VITLPDEWQQYIQDGTIPLNFFWELQKSVIDPLARLRPELLRELNADHIRNVFVRKRLKGIITDVVSLRNVTPIIRYSAVAEDEGGQATTELDQSIRDLVADNDTTIEEVYENTVQIMVEVDKLGRRAASMVAAFSRLMFTSSTDEDRTNVRAIAGQLILQLQRLIGDEQSSIDQAS
jgi:hypothetical protein